jgi:hypothetical protein
VEDMLPWAGGSEVLHLTREVFFLFVGRDSSVADVLSGGLGLFFLTLVKEAGVDSEQLIELSLIIQALAIDWKRDGAESTLARPLLQCGFRDLHTLCDAGVGDVSCRSGV